MRRAPAFGCMLACALLSAPAPACLLPKFDKVEEEATAPKSCGLASKLGTSCERCIQKSCCELADACGKGTECGADILKPITPYAVFSDEFQPLLACLQTHCEAACKVNWGCLGNYSVPVPEGSFEIPITVVDFAAEPLMPIPDVTVEACSSIDSACESGLATSEVSDENGQVKLAIESPTFNGFFQFTGGGYVPATAQFSEPIYRSLGFAQPLLQQKAIEGFAQATGVHENASDPFDPTLGHLIFRAQNCLPMQYLDRAAPPHAEAADVRVSIDGNEAGSTIFYTDDSSSVSLSQTSTSSDGFGGAFDLPAHNLTVTAVDADDRKLASGVVVMRPQTIGFIYLLPTGTR